MDTIVFDLDDTLIVEEDSACAAFVATCRLAHERCGVEPDQLHTAVRRTCRNRWHRSPARDYCLQVGISSWEGLWAEFLGDDSSLSALREWACTYRTSSWHDALTECGCEDAALACELAETFVSERRKPHVVYDDVLPSLARLRHTHRLGLLTNGAPDLQRRKLANSGLEGYFHEVLISGEVGWGKPEERIFTGMLTRLETVPESAVMVGNSLRSDIQPAQAAGMKGVWINREGKTRDDSIVPDREIASLLDLLV